MFGCCFVLQGRQVCGAVVWCCREAGQACLLLCGAAGDEPGWGGCGWWCREGRKGDYVGGVGGRKEGMLVDIVLCGVSCRGGKAGRVGVQTTEEC